MTQQQEQRCALCTQEAETFCSIGTCAPGTWFCSYHYEQTHLPESERVKAWKPFFGDPTISHEELFAEEMNLSEEEKERREYNRITNMLKDALEEQEPTLQQCPYCQQLHEPHLIDACPLKPKHL